MEQSTIAILIIFAALILYLFPKIPIYVTTILAALAMGTFGIIDYSKSLAGFGNSAALLIVGMMIMGQACLTTGIADKVSNIITKFAKTEKMFVIIILVVGIILGAFLNGALVVALLMAIANVVIYNSDGKISRKATYMPISFGAVLGNNLTSVSASSMVTASAIIVAAGYKQMGVFEVTLVTLPGVALFVLFYYFFGYKLSKKWWNFPDIPLDDVPVNEEKKEYPVWRMWVTGIVLVAVVTMIVRGANMGFASLLGACILILTGCIDAKAAMKAVDWPTYIIAACALGMSAGLSASGGGAVIADFIIKICGPIGESAWGMCLVIFIVATILSNIMSDSATVAIVVPIALSIAQTMGWDALPLAIAAATGTKVALATPICVSCHTMVAPAGYRFIDYFSIGGIQNVLQFVVTAIMLKVVYF